MQNLIQLEDDVKGLPDQALQQLAKAPNPQVPQFLVISEIQRRGDMRKRFEARQQQQPQGALARRCGRRRGRWGGRRPRPSSLEP